MDLCILRILQLTFTSHIPEYILYFKIFKQKNENVVVPCLIKHYAMKTYGEWRYSSTHS
jgi:hypothetical protein